MTAKPVLRGPIELGHCDKRSARASPKGRSARNTSGSPSAHATSIHDPAGLANLTENRLRLLASLAGTAFAVTLMFMEHGFQQSLLESMVGLIRHLDGDLMIVSRTVYTLSVPYGFPYRRLEQARAFPEVRAAVPVSIETRRSFWRSAGRWPAAADPRRRLIRRDDDALDIAALKARATSGRGRARPWPTDARGPSGSVRWRPGSSRSSRARPCASSALSSSAPTTRATAPSS